MMENFSTHTEIFCTGGRAGRGSWPGIGVRRWSPVISDISTYSSSNIFFATLGGRTALGLYGPPHVRVDVTGEPIEVVDGCVVLHPPQSILEVSSSRKPAPLTE